MPGGPGPNGGSPRFGSLASQRDALGFGDGDPPAVARETATTVSADEGAPLRPAAKRRSSRATLSKVSATKTTLRSAAHREEHGRQSLRLRLAVGLARMGNGSPPPHDLVVPLPHWAFVVEPPTLGQAVRKIVN